MNIDIAVEAGKRWLSREKKRQRLTAEGPMNAEPRERIQARLDHLRTAAARPAPALSRAVIDSIAQERVLGRPDFLGIQVLELGAAVARYVARINVRDRLNNTVAFGTGFMVSPRLLMTNNHVLPDADSARGSVAEFDYQANWLGQPPPVKMFALEPDTFFLTDKQLDYTLVAVAERTSLGVALSDYAWMRLVAAQGKILLNDPVSIIQHPNGEMKQIAFRDGRLVDLPGEFAHYTTDTEPGSSGSPVTNDQWEVVALHHSGVPKMRDGDLVSRRDGIWRQGDPPEDLVWVANEGIRVSALVGSIRSKPLSGAQDRLRGELLDLEPPHPVELAYRVFTRDRLATPPERLDSHGSLGACGCTVNDSGLGVTLSIPLTVTVRFGDERASRSLDTLPPPAKVTTETTLAFEKAVQPIVDPDYSNRRGYAPDFLGIPVPLPTVRQPSNVATLEDGDPVIPYQHFSIVVHKQRRLALFTASNVDGSPSARKPEPGDYSRKGLTGLGESDQEQWLTDPRLPEAQQLPDKFYTKDKGAFDKGHIVRREDVCWGTSYDEVRRANGDTYHTTNCSPQVADFNRSGLGGEWGKLEDHVLKQAKVGERYSIFAGPILADDDRPFEGVDERGTVRVRIPSRYWKIVLVADQGSLRAFAFLLTQDLSAVPLEEFSVGPWKPAMIGIQELEDLLGSVSFPSVLKQADQLGTAMGNEVCHVARILPPARRDVVAREDAPVAH